MQIARAIGKIDSPMDFDVWVGKYPPTRRGQIREALNLPYSTQADFFHKVEKLDEDKVPRAIQARCDAYKARVGPWVAALEHRAREVLPLIKGLEPSGQAVRIQQLRQRATNVVEIDYSRFDRHCSAELLESTEQLVYAYCFPPGIADMLHDQLLSTCGTRHGLKYRLYGTRLSGDMNTSIGNCIVNLSLIMAAGLPMDAVLVEGDDMLACPTNAELNTLDLDVIKEAGQRPTVRVNPEDGGTFCSRYEIPTAIGLKRVRKPLRDLMRFGWAIHSENVEEIIETHWNEWRGVPMLGPAYEECMISRGREIQRIPITPEARAAFHLIFGYNATEQQQFERDPKARAAIYARLQADATCGGERDTSVSRTTSASDGRKDEDSPVLPGSVGPPTPRRASSDVRDVQDAGPRAGRIPDGCRDHHSGRSHHRNRLRPEGLQPIVRSDGGPVPKDRCTRVEKCTTPRARQHSDETAVVHHHYSHRRPSHGSDNRPGNPQLAVRHSGIRNPSDLHRQPVDRINMGGVRHRACVPKTT